MDAGGKAGALYATAGAIVDIQQCAFDSNHARLNWEVGGLADGGAIYTESGTRLTVARSTFTNNTTAGFEGGDAGAMFTGGRATVDSCEIAGNEGMGAILSTAPLIVRGSVFHDNIAGYGSSGIHSQDSLTVSNCVFRDNHGSFEATILGAGPSRIQHNTLAYNADLAIFANLGGPVSGNIVAHNRQGVSAYEKVVLSCNDLWSNDQGNYVAMPDPTGTKNNISADPQFCDPDARELMLFDTSPCAPGASACGLIGALPVQCTVTTVGDAPGHAYALAPVRPNPARGPLTFAFELPHAAWVRLEVLDVTGRHLATVAAGAFAAGRHEARWSGIATDGSPAAPGVYLVVLRSEGMQRSRHFSVTR